MKKKLLIELINYLEEFLYNNKKSSESFLTLSHLYYITRDNENFIKNLNFFQKKTNEKNIVDIEKLVFFDNSFDVVVQEELYFYLENNYNKNAWEEKFISRSVEFLNTLSNDYYLKPYFLCELLKNTPDIPDHDICKQIITIILTGFSNTKWEISALKYFSVNMEKIFLNYEFEDKPAKIEFLKEFREHLLFFATKYPEEKTACKYLFKLAEFLKELDQDLAIKLYSMISDAYVDEVIKVTVLFELGNIYYKKEDIDKTVEIYTELFNNFETRKEIIHMKYKAACFLFNNCYYKNSFIIFREIAQKFRNTKWAKDSSVYILKIAKVFFEEEEYEEAEFYINEVLSLKNNRDDVSNALYLKAKIFDYYSENKFSYDRRNYYQNQAVKIYRKLVENYNDNKDILTKIDIKYLEEDNSSEHHSIDINYIILITSVILLSIIVFIKMV